MKFNIAENFILLNKKPDKAGYYFSGPVLSAGLTGAVLFDLSLEGKIELKEQVIIAKSAKTDLSETHDQVLKILYNDKKVRKIKNQIARISRKSCKYRHQILSDLEKKRIVRVENKRFLFIPYKSARVLDTSVRSKLIDELRAVVLKGKKPDPEMTSLLGLVEAGKMYKVLSRDKSEIKKIKAKLKDILSDDSISQGVNKVIREMQAAIAAAVVVTSAGATSGGR